MSHILYNINPIILPLFHFSEFRDCEPGSIRNNFGICVMCEADTVQVGDTCEPCPEGTNSDEGATECVGM